MGVTDLLIILGTAITTVMAAVWLSGDILAPRALKALNASGAQMSERLNGVFSGLPQGIAVFGPSGTMVTCNPAFQRVAGLAPEIIGQCPKLSRVISEFRRLHGVFGQGERSTKDAQLALSQGGFRSTWTLADGRSLTLTSQRLDTGDVVVMLRDVTATITLSRSVRMELDQFEAVLDQLPDALAVFSSSGVLTFSNAAYRALWPHTPEAAFADVTREQALSHWTQALVDPATAEALQAHVQTQNSEPFTLVTQGHGPLICQVHALSTSGTMVQFCADAREAVTS